MSQLQHGLVKVDNIGFYFIDIKPLVSLIKDRLTRENMATPLNRVISHKVERNNKSFNIKIYYDNHEFSIQGEFLPYRIVVGSVVNSNGYNLIVGNMIASYIEALILSEGLTKTEQRHLGTRGRLIQQEFKSRFDDIGSKTTLAIGLISTSVRGISSKNKIMVSSDNLDEYVDRNFLTKVDLSNYKDEILNSIDLTKTSVYTDISPSLESHPMYKKIKNAFDYSIGNLKEISSNRVKVGVDLEVYNAVLQNRNDLILSMSSMARGLLLSENTSIEDLIQFNRKMHGTLSRWANSKGRNEINTDLVVYDIFHLIYELEGRNNSESFKELLVENYKVNTVSATRIAKNFFEISKHKKASLPKTFELSKLIIAMCASGVVLNISENVVHIDLDVSKTTLLLLIDDYILRY